MPFPRSDDNKEGTFELSLFAELFNEMMMRDSAFKIYKKIVSTPKPDTGKEDKDKKEDKEDEDKQPEVVEEEKKQMVTRNRDLLLAFSYFDLSHIGYIEAKVIS